VTRLFLSSSGGIDAGQSDEGLPKDEVAASISSPQKKELQQQEQAEKVPIWVPRKMKEKRKLTNGCGTRQITQLEQALERLRRENEELQRYATTAETLEAEMTELHQRYQEEVEESEKMRFVNFPSVLF